MERLLIFDFDGVIADSLQCHIRAMEQTYAAFGKPLPFTDFRSWYHSNWEQNWVRGGFTLTDLPAIIPVYARYLSYDQAEIFPGVGEAICVLAQSATLVIASTTAESFISPYLKRHDMRQCFKAIYSSNTGSSKQKLLEQAIGSYAPRHVVVVGDTSSDILPARALGCRTIGAGWGWYGAARLAEAEPDILLEDPTELLSTLHSLLSESTSA